MRIASGLVLGALGLAGLGWAAATGPESFAAAVLASGGLTLGVVLGGSRTARAGGHGNAAELAALRQEAREARAELDAIHSSVSHDLRSPIGASLNFLTVFEEDHGAQLDGEGRAVLARVRRSAQSALALLDGLARLARVGRQPMEPRPVDVDALVRRTFAAARPAERAIELRIDEPLPPVVADPELLAIAFRELLANAVRFTAGREKASIAVGAERNGDGVVDYWVADDGAGFDPRFTRNLFHVFERLHSRDEFPGVGAGLAVVRRVAERHGGRVRADGRPEQGATFHLSLPERGPGDAAGAAPS